MYQVDEKGFFGKFGGAYVPEILSLLSRLEIVGVEKARI